MKKRTYSKSEEHLLSILRFNKVLTTKALVEKHYQGEFEMPAPGDDGKSPIKAMTFLLRKLQLKINDNVETFNLRSEPTVGGGENQYWLEGHF